MRRKICAASSASPCSRHTVPKLAVANVSSARRRASAEPPASVPPPEHLHHSQARLRSEWVQRRGLTQVRQRFREPAGSTLQLTRQAMRLRVRGIPLEDHAHLGQRRLRISAVDECLGQDQARGGVLGEPFQPLPAEPDGFSVRPALRWASASGAKASDPGSLASRSS